MGHELLVGESLVRLVLFEPSVDLGRHELRWLRDSFGDDALVVLD